MPSLMTFSRAIVAAASDRWGNTLPPPKKSCVIALAIGGTYWCVTKIWKSLGPTIREELSRSLVRKRVELAGVVCGWFTTYHPNRHLRGHWQRDAKLNIAAPAPGHSHGRAAAARTAAAITMDRFIHDNGYVPYNVSSCAREDPNDPAYHQWFIGKDLSFPRRNDSVTDNAIIKMVDVDYYVEWRDWVCYKRPIILYTFLPDDVSFSDEEYSYSLTRDGVIMDVSGGREYEHQLWDYSVDHVVVWTRWAEWVVCSIDVKSVDRHHAIVFINPICTVRWFGWLVPERTLTRKRFGYGTGIAHSYRRAEQSAGDPVVTVPGGDFISLGICQAGRAVTSVTIPVSLWHAIVIRIARSKHPNISDVERYLRSEGRGRMAAHEAPPLFELACSQDAYLMMPQVAHRPGSFVPVRYQAVAGLVTEDGKEIGRSVCAPLVSNPDVIPNRSYNNDYASVTGRVGKVLNNKEPPARYIKYAAEFVRRLVGEHVGVGTPIEIQEVIEAQNRPTQRGRSAQVMHWIAGVNPVEVRAFMKGESYAKASDPRNISTVGAAHTLRLSSYTYPFKYDVLYPLPVYAPGKPPKVVAETISRFAQDYAVLSETDYSRFDGTISMWLRENVERAAYVRWCHPDHRSDLVALLSAELNPRASTSNGLAYAPMASRLSGSPLTTDGNTMINLFVMFAAACTAGLSHQAAWDLLGPAGGDDGVSPIKPAYLQRAASELGLKLKCERREDGHVCFLGRVFYNASSGEIGSLQDPLRTWRKLHISFAPSYVTDRQALANRAAGYRALDPGAPVLMEWCAKVQELTGLEGALDDDAPFFVTMAERDPSFGGWPQLSYFDGLEAIAWRLDVGADEVADLASRITMVTSLQGFDRLWGNEEPDTGVAAVVDGEIRDIPNDAASSIATAPVALQRNRRPGVRPRTIGAPPRRHRPRPSP